MTELNVGDKVKNKDNGRVGFIQRILTPEDIDYTIHTEHPYALVSYEGQSIATPAYLLEVVETFEDRVKNEMWYDKHYEGDVQPIELMQAQFDEDAMAGFLRGNIIKYTARLGKKDHECIKDARKILRYAEWLVEVCEGKTINPRE